MVKYLKTKSMKAKTICLLLGVIWMSSCTIYQPYPNTERNLTPIPTPSHENKVEVFFPNEEIKEEYVKVKVLEVRGTGNTSYQNMLNRLTEVGQEAGVDAILILKNSSTASFTTDETSFEAFTEVLTGEEIPDNVQPIVRQKLYGLGVKYIKNINYLDQIRKKRKIFLHEGNDKVEVASASLDLQGNIGKIEGDRDIWFEMYGYSLDHLLYEDDLSWSFFRENNRLVRLKKSGLNPAKKVTIQYGMGNYLAFMIVNDYYFSDGYQRRRKSTIDFLYDKKTKKVRGKIIKKDDKSELYEELIYDENQIIKERILYKVKGENKTPYLSESYDYFDNIELVKLLDN